MGNHQKKGGYIREYGPVEGRVRHFIDNLRKVLSGDMEDD